MNTDEREKGIVHLSWHKNQQGLVLVLFAFLLFPLLGIAALAIDIGYVAVTKNELQNSADAAALAGAGKLGSIYKDQTPPLALTSTQEGEIATLASMIGKENKAAGQSPDIKTSDIQIGIWDAITNKFTYPLPNPLPVFTLPNAVRVTVRPDENGSIPTGSVTTFFAKIFEVSSVPVSATATAALSAPCMVQPDKLSPIVISDESPYCNANPDIVFTSNDPQPCGAWQTFDQVANTDNIRDLINTLMYIKKCNMECGKKSSTEADIPSKDVGDTVNVMNGLSADVWECFQNLYKCSRNPDTKVWTLSVPVVDRPCGQLNQIPPIVAFATVDIKGVTIGSGSNVVVEGVACGSSPCIKASVVCNKVIPEKGGGCKFYGTYGSIPGLVDKGGS